MHEKLEKLEKMGHQSQPPYGSTHMPFDFYDFPKDIPLEEYSEQGGVGTTLSFFSLEKHPLREQHTWQKFPKIDMHQFEGSDPAGWIS